MLTAGFDSSKERFIQRTERRQKHYSASGVIIARISIWNQLTKNQRITPAAYIASRQTIKNDHLSRNEPVMISS